MDHRQRYKSNMTQAELDAITDAYRKLPRNDQFRKLVEELSRAFKKKWPNVTFSEAYALEVLGSLGMNLAKNGGVRCQG